MPTRGGVTLSSDFLSTVGLVLNFGAIISMALWFSTAGSHSSSGLRMLPGALTVLFFAGSIVCFSSEQCAPQSESQDLPFHKAA